ncbi:CWC16 protein [Pyrenochaeta sp. MPI-SDFR-AT-0127]|nr:CWC16 protein [Pyrenochaeta sp. MPI-SDFR-AT-0127]
MQGFNMGRYYPPDASNAPSFNTNSHPLGKRASKVTQGILTVRFELPFAVWCDHCTPPAIIGQGVRFNAEKKKVGNYYSTPIWSFRMKHSACGGWWEIRTDPQKSEYVVVEGAKRRDYGPDDRGAEADGDLKFLTEEEREKRREDAFANLEGKLEEKGLEKKNKERVEELYEKSEVWRDPYDVNARLRKDFRVKRKLWKKEERHKEGMQDKFSLGLEIADETEADRTRAGLIHFGASEEKDKEESSWRPLFAGKNSETSIEPVPKTKKLKSEIAAEKSRQNLQQTLVSNTRAAIDPFMSKEGLSNSRPSFGILKRKRDGPVDKKLETPTSQALPEQVATIDDVPSKKPALLSALVGYDSD